VAHSSSASGRFWGIDLLQPMVFACALFGILFDRRFSSSSPFLAVLEDSLHWEDEIALVKIQKLATLRKFSSLSPKQN
jgi:hypothetical protein